MSCIEVTVEVLPEDAVGAKRKDCGECVVARAFKRAVPEANDVTVEILGPTAGWVSWSVAERRYSTVLPRALSRCAYEFDIENRVSHVRAALSIPVPDPTEGA